MSFNKRFLPSTGELESVLEKRGADYFYKTYVQSPDALIGDQDSIEFISAFSKRYESNKGFKSIY